MFPTTGLMKSTKSTVYVNPSQPFTGFDVSFNVPAGNLTVILPLYVPKSVSVTFAVTSPSENAISVIVLFSSCAKSLSPSIVKLSAINAFLTAVSSKYLS